LYYFSTIAVSAFVDLTCTAYHYFMESEQPPKTEKLIGAVLVKTGRCPLQWTDTRNCFYCPYGAPTWCHFPQRHHEVLCGHRAYLVHQQIGGEKDAYERRPATFL
jgi:hypothetical protein